MRRQPAVLLLLALLVMSPTARASGPPEVDLGPHRDVRAWCAGAAVEGRRTGLRDRLGAYRGRAARLVSEEPGNG